MSNRREEDEDDREVQGAAGGEGESNLAEKDNGSNLCVKMPQIFFPKLCLDVRQSHNVNVHDQILL